MSATRYLAPDGSVLGFPVVEYNRVVAWHISPGPMTDAKLLRYAEIGRMGCGFGGEMQADTWRREMARAELRRRNALETA